MEKKRSASRRPAHKPESRPARPETFWFTLPLAYIILAVACLAVYGRASGFNVSGLDDDTLLGAFAGHHYHWWDAFTCNAFMIQKGADFYRPLQSLLFIFAAALGGTNPFAFHVINITLHVLAIAALFRLLLLLGFNRQLSFVLTLTFALSPLFAQAVAWIPGCGDLLLGLFGVLAFGSMLKFQSTRDARQVAIHAVCLLLAMLSKESGLLLPVLFAVWLAQEQKRGAVNLANLGLAGTWVACGSLYLLLRHLAISSLPARNIFGVLPFANNLRVLPETFGRLFACVDIPVMPSFTPGMTLIGIAAAAAVIAILWMQRKLLRPKVLFGVLWFVLLSVPGMMYTHELGSHAYNYLNHRAYLPMVGLFMVFGEAIPATWYSGGKRLVLWAGSALGLVLAIVAWNQSGYFADPPAFYNQAIRTNPQSALALNNRGKLRSDGDDKQGAMQDFDNAIRIHPHYSMAYNNRGNNRGLLGDVPGAVADLTQAVSLDTTYALGFSNLGRWKAIMNNLPGALEDYNKSIRLDSTFAGSYNNRGALFGQLGDYERAGADFRKAIAADPGFSEAFVNLGRVELHRNKMAEACALWREAARLGNRTGEAMLAQYCR